MNRELKCGHCAASPHERLPKRLHDFCDSHGSTPDWVTNRMLQQKATVAKELYDDYLSHGKISIKYDPSSCIVDDPDSRGHQYVLTTPSNLDWLWCYYVDDRTPLRPQIVRWFNDVALWFAEMAETVAEEHFPDVPVVAIYEVVLDGEVRFRTLVRSQAIAYCEGVNGSQNELKATIFEHVVKLDARNRTEVTP